ncbi:MAG: histidine phosphatase family protein [Synergistales bacterium]|nr:histidine phosphatase family protein [Synergistales bacterium]
MEQQQTTTFLVVRHGECKGNREGLFRGRCDFPLNSAGLRQARALAAAVQHLPITRCYTSPLSRSVTTAEHIAERAGCGWEPHEGFNNIALGPWEGRSKDHIAATYPDEWRLWRTSPEALALPDAERLDSVRERSFQALERLAAEHAGEHVAVVSHRAVIKPLLAACLGIASPYFWRLHVDTASYSIVTHSPTAGYCLILLNETGHLESFVRELV